MQSNSIECFRKTLRALERKLERGQLHSTSCCGITIAQCHALLEIDRSSGSTMGELAKSLDIDRSTATRVVDELVKAKLVVRVTDDADRRSVRIVLTEAGMRKAEGIDRDWNGFYEKALAKLDEPRRNALLESVPAFVDAISECIPPKGGCA